MVPVVPGALLVWAAILVWGIDVGTATGWGVVAAATVMIAGGQVVKYTIPSKQLSVSGVPKRSLVIGALVPIPRRRSRRGAGNPSQGGSEFRARPRLPGRFVTADGMAARSVVGRFANTMFIAAAGGVADPTAGGGQHGCQCRREDVKWNGAAGAGRGGAMTAVVMRVAAELRGRWWASLVLAALVGLVGGVAIAERLLARGGRVPALTG